MSYQKKVSIAELRAAVKYDPHTGDLFCRTDAATVRRCDRSGGWVVQFRGFDIPAHRAAWALTHGEWPGYFIKHVNKDKRDNRIENLKLGMALKTAASDETATPRPRKVAAHEVPKYVTVDDVQAAYLYDAETGDIVSRETGEVTTGERVNAKGFLVLRHYVAWVLHYGQWPAKWVRLRDGNPANNRIDNLEETYPGAAHGAYWDAELNGWVARVPLQWGPFATREEAWSTVCAWALTLKVDGYADAVPQDLLDRISRAISAEKDRKGQEQ